MAEYGITDKGFSRKRLDLLLQELNSEVKAIFGENFNVSPESPDGQINGVVSESNANLWEIAEEAYNAFNPSLAKGNTLSNLVQINGITRIAAKASRALLTASGTAGTVIPQNSIVKTSDTEVEFLTEQQVTILSGGSVDVFASATITGPIQALAGTLTEIETPITGWDSVTNTEDAILGNDEETDPELRARRRRSVARDAQSIIDSIRAEILAVAGVTQLVILENDTSADPDAQGLPAHSIQAVVLGGEDANIARAIFLKKTLGANTFGEVTVNIQDTQGFDHPINFSRPVEVPIYVVVNITVIDEFPAEGPEQIKQAIVDYVNGDLVTGRGFFLGDDVIHSELYTPINTVPGFTVDDLFIGTSASPTTDNDIPIDITELATFDIANIEVVES